MTAMDHRAAGLTLASAPLRAPLLVLRLRTDPDLTKRLGAFGVRPGAPVEIVQRTAGGGRILGVAGSRIALDRSILAAIDAEQVAG
jgi:ferrous iron transport protein A